MDHPAFMRARLAVKRAFGGIHRADDDSANVLPLALVGLSGGADSLALAAAVAGEAQALGVRAGAIVVDHGLQDGSELIAERAAGQARALGLNPVIVQRVTVGGARASDGGPEAVARSARYRAFREVAAAHDARWVLTAHTRDDQAEQVLLSLARGSGTRSLSGIPLTRPLSESTTMLRPFLFGELEITRETTEACCAELALDPWIDPHNDSHEYARVRVRTEVLPTLERELGARAVQALARTADLAREDADALDCLATQFVRTWLFAEPSGLCRIPRDGVAELLELPAAIRQRVIRTIAQQEFGAQLTREHALRVTALITDWRGQGPAFVPGIRVERVRSGNDKGALTFSAQIGSPRHS